jgi:hypothetical protein
VYGRNKTWSALKLILSEKTQHGAIFMKLTMNFPALPNENLNRKIFVEVRNFRVTVRRLMLVLVAALVLGPALVGHAAELPAESDQGPVPAPHFPDALHAVIWRNWQLVEPARLAKVLRTTPDRIIEMAVSMGLPAEVKVPPQMMQRGYITLVRRNWHLMPLEQLMELLDVSAEEMAFKLREDDGLIWKMAFFRPKVPPVTYAEPSEAARQRAAEIKKFVEAEFGDLAKVQAEPRFEFISRLSAVPDSTRAELAKQDDKLRFIYSYFGVYGDPLSDPAIDPYPEGLLARLQECGVNGVWLHVLLRQLAPGGETFPEFGEGHELRLKNLQAMVARAKKYGIDVYLFMLEPRAMERDFFANRPEMMGASDTLDNNYASICTSDPRVRKWMGDSLSHVFREVPGLGGVFTITASEMQSNCASHANRHECPRCGPRPGAEVIAEVNRTIRDGVHSAAPNAKVITWDWGWNNHGDAVDMIAVSPKNTWFMSVSEWSLPIERGGVPYTIGEYSLSAVGPGPRATRHWQAAEERGLKRVAKVQLSNSWELSAVPYLPVYDLVAEHCSRLAQRNLDGMMLSWSLGGYPSPNLELAAEFSRQPTLDRETAILALAKKHFGSAAAPQVRQAWRKFSDALREFPFSKGTLYNAPHQFGPANLLFVQPTGRKAGPVCYPYDDLATWCDPYPTEVLAAQFQKVAQGWAEGLKDLRSAQEKVSQGHKAFADSDLDVAEAAQIHYASTTNQVKFVMKRDALLQKQGSTPPTQLTQELNSLLEDEIQLAKRLFQLSCKDSRLGYEASNHYYYVPLDLVEKCLNCAQLREQYSR